MLLLVILMGMPLFSAGHAQAAEYNREEYNREEYDGEKSDSNELEVTHLEKNSFSCVFDGVKHVFLLDLPENSEGAALVVMLHGYGNTAESFRSRVHFEQVANPRGYAVVYVTGAPNPNDPVSATGWNAGIAPAGNDDAAFLSSLARYLQQAYSLDEERTFAVGFSNGGFMAHRLAMEAGDVFEACVSVAGMMPAKIWDERKETNSISFFQIYGEKDELIPKYSDGSAGYAKDPAIEDVTAYWASSNGLALCETQEIGNGSVLTRYWGEQIPDQVWNLFVKNGRHAWPDEEQNGIDTNSLLLTFFDAVSIQTSGQSF